MDWQGDRERRSLAYLTLCHDLSVMAIRNFPAHAEADAGAFKFLPRVEALKRSENLLGELLLEADPVIRHADLRKRRSVLRGGKFAVEIEQNTAGDTDLRLF